MLSAGRLAADTGCWMLVKTRKRIEHRETGIKYRETGIEYREMNRRLRNALKGVVDPDIERRRRAMERFVRATFGMFIRYLYRYLGNEVECEDVLEDVYADMWEDPTHLRGVTTERQLLRNVYLYYMRGHLRKIYRERNRHLNLSQEGLKKLIAPDIGILEMMSENELQEAVCRMLSKLKTRERKCIELWMEGMSNRAIANELNKTVDAVKMLKFRTILKLRKLMRREQVVR